MHTFALEVDLKGDLQSQGKLCYALPVGALHCRGDSDDE